MTEVVIVAVLALAYLLAGLLALSLCVVSSRADEEAERW